MLQNTGITDGGQKMCKH